MKRLILILMISFINTTLFAKKDSIITNFFEEGTAFVEVWLRYDDKSLNGKRVQNIFLNEIEKDTIINNTRYWAVSIRSWYDYSTDTLGYKSPDFYYLTMKGNGELQVLYCNVDSPITLYSFGEKGFSIRNSIVYLNQNDKYTQETITQIDTIMLSGGYKSIIANEKYIYGLGHKSHPLFWSDEDWNPSLESYHSLNRFLCLFYKGEIILQDDELMEQIKKSIGMDADHLLPPTSKDRKEPAAPIYDLTGRRLNSVPEKGIYIQGGKKWMVK